MLQHQPSDVIIHSPIQIVLHFCRILRFFT